MVNDVFPYNVHIHKEFLRVSVGIIFLNLSFLNIFDMKLLMGVLVRYIVLLNNIVSFYQHHQTLAYPYNVHIQNNHHGNMVHIVYNQFEFFSMQKSINRNRNLTEHVYVDLLQQMFYLYLFDNVVAVQASGVMLLYYIDYFHLYDDNQ